MTAEINAADFPENYAPVIDEQSGVNVNIHIACDSLEELLTHLSVIRSQIKKQAINKEGYAEWKVMDNNCYGTHVAQINW